MGPTYSGTFLGMLDRRIVGPFVICSTIRGSTGREGGVGEERGRVAGERGTGALGCSAANECLVATGADTALPNNGLEGLRDLEEEEFVGGCS